MARSSLKKREAMLSSDRMNELFSSVEDKDVDIQSVYKPVKSNEFAFIEALEETDKVLEEKRKDTVGLGKRLVLFILVTFFLVLTWFLVYATYKVITGL